MLSSLGIEVLDERGDELTAECPAHLRRVGRRDENPSWSLNAESGLHHCFSCGFRGNVSQLVAHQRGVSLDEAREWLSRREVDLVAVSGRLEAAKAHVTPFRPVEMSEARLALFTDPPGWALEERGLTAAAASRHGVLWNEANDSWITPIRDAIHRALLGWQEKGQRDRTFRNRPAGVPKSRTLFGFDVWDGGQMVVVESPLDVVRLTSLGIRGGVATFGASVSREQVFLMLAADELVIAFDNDPAGRRAAEQLLRMSREMSFECRFFDYRGISAKDVGEMLPHEVDRGVDGSRHCVLGKAAL